jgi:hypothetical protein
MLLLKSFRVVLTLTVLTMLIQAAFAGRIIGGNAQAVTLHEGTAKILVLLACGQLLLASALRVQARCPLWIPLASGALLAAEVLEFAAGHAHNVALHVPLGVAIFGGALRHLFWSMREANIISSVQV